jgi:hypothetical protein
MIRYSVFLVLTIALISVAVYALPPEVFTVLQVKGAIMVSHDRSGTWTTPSPGEKLRFLDLIRVGRNSYLSLLHINTGKTIELKTEGRFSAKELSIQLESTPAKGTEKFAAYVFSELKNAKGGDPIESYRQKHMQTTGSVERAAGDYLIKVFMPRTMNVIDSSLQFSWYRYKDSPKYTLKITNAMGKTIHSQDVQDTVAQINVATLGLTSGTGYFWSVGVSLRESSDEYCLFILDESTKKGIIDTINIIRKEFGEESALGSLYCAAYFEQHKLYSRALEFYRKAIILAVDVPEYHKAYALFLTRIGLVQEAKQLAGGKKW